MATPRKDKRYTKTARNDQGKRVFGYGYTEQEAAEDLKRKLNLSPDLDLIPSDRLHDFVVGIWRPSLSGRSDATTSRYELSYRSHINAQLGNLPLSAINFRALHQWVMKLRVAGVSDPSILYARGVLSNILNLAVKYELISRNPAADVDAGERPAVRVRVMSPDQAAKLLDDVTGTPLSAPVFLAAVLGLRRGECIGLKWDDLDRQRGELLIRRQRAHPRIKGAGVKEQAPKGNKTRVMRLPKAFIAQIDTRGDLDSPYICTREDQRSGKIVPWVPNTLTEDWAAASEKLGFPDWTFHDLRHGAAGLAYAATRNVLAVQSILGHASPDMSLVYLGQESDVSGLALDGVAELFK